VSRRLHNLMPQGYHVAEMASDSFQSLYSVSELAGLSSDFHTLEHTLLSGRVVQISVEIKGKQAQCKHQRMRPLHEAPRDKYKGVLQCEQIPWKVQEACSFSNTPSCAKASSLP
jgi:hypothetical protein